MYIDPGSGSVLLQLILGAIFTIGVSYRYFWKKIKAKLFSKNSSTSTKSIE
jgi:hypothetical protein